MSKLPLKQLEINDISDGYIIRYNSSSGIWEATDVNVAVPTILDKEQTPSTTNGDNADTGLTISNTPTGSRYVDVKINGISYRLGNGIKTKDCYFSDDSGSTAKNLSNIESGDKLYWNGNIAGFDLTTEDVIDFEYNTGTFDTNPIYPGLVFIEKKTITSATSNVLFEDLDGDADQVYKLIYRIKNASATTVYSLEPNGSSLNCTSISTNWNDSGITQASHASSLSFTRVTGTDGFTAGELIFHAARNGGVTSMYRVMHSSSSCNGSSGTYGDLFRGEWQNTSTNLTSLNIAGGTNEINSGSEFVLYKMRQV